MGNHDTFFDEEVYGHLAEKLHGSAPGSSGLRMPLPRNRNNLFKLLAELYESGRNFRPALPWKSTLASTLLVVFGDAITTYDDETRRPVNGREKNKRTVSNRTPPEDITLAFTDWLIREDLFSLWNACNPSDDQIGTANRYSPRMRLLDRIVAYGLGIDRRGRGQPESTCGWYGRWHLCMDYFVSLYVTPALKKTHQLLIDTIPGLQSELEAEVRGSSTRSDWSLKEKEEAWDFAVYLLWRPSWPYDQPKGATLSIERKHGNTILSGLQDRPNMPQQKSKRQKKEEALSDLQNRPNIPTEITLVPGPAIHLLSNRSQSISHADSTQPISGVRRLLRIERTGDTLLLSTPKPFDEGWQTITRKSSQLDLGFMCHGGWQQAIRVLTSSLDADAFLDRFCHYLPPPPIFQAKFKHELRLSIRWRQGVWSIYAGDENLMQNHSVHLDHSLYLSFNLPENIFVDGQEQVISPPGSHCKITATEDSYQIHTGRPDKADLIKFLQKPKGITKIPSSAKSSRWQLVRFRPRLLEDLQQWPSQNDISLSNWILSCIAGGCALSMTHRGKEILANPDGFFNGVYSGFTSEYGILGNTDLQLRKILVFQKPSQEDGSEGPDAYKVTEVLAYSVNGLLPALSKAEFFACKNRHYLRKSSATTIKSCPQCGNNIRTQKTIHGYIFDSRKKITYIYPDDSSSQDLEESGADVNLWERITYETQREYISESDDVFNPNEITDITDYIDRIHLRYNNSLYDLENEIRIHINKYYEEALTQQGQYLLDHLCAYCVAHQPEKASAFLLCGTDSIDQIALRILLIVIYAAKSKSSGKKLNDFLIKFLSDDHTYFLLKSVKQPSYADKILPTCFCIERKLKPKTLETLINRINELITKSTISDELRKTLDQLKDILESGNQKMALCGEEPDQ